MELRVPRRVIEDVDAHAQDAYPEECCGFLIGRKDGGSHVVEQSRRTENVHPKDRGTRYSIDGREILKIEHEFRGETRLVGVYHSHPDYPAKPSSFDARRVWPWYAYLIVAVTRGKAGDRTALEFDEAAGAFRSVSLEIL